MLARRSCFSATNLGASPYRARRAQVALQWKPIGTIGCLWHRLPTNAMAAPIQVVSAAPSQVQRHLLSPWTRPFRSKRHPTACARLREKHEEYLKRQVPSLLFVHRLRHSDENNATQAEMDAARNAATSARLVGASCTMHFCLLIASGARRRQTLFPTSLGSMLP